MSQGNHNKYQKKQGAQSSFQQRKGNAENIAQDIATRIDGFSNGLREYTTRQLVEDAEKLGTALAEIDLKTNQIRKFLDAVKQLKVKLRVGQSLRRNTNLKEEEIESIRNYFPESVNSELPLLRPKIAYAAAKQRKSQRNQSGFGPVDPLEKVLISAIKKVEDHPEDFLRLSQLIESIVAYHKAAGGKDQ